MDRKVLNHLMVGAIATAGFLAFLFILFNIGGGTGLLASHYTLYGKFKHVKGLHSGSEVSLSGLRIGVIKDITIAADDSKVLTVELSIINRVKERIRGDSMATIRTQGVLGDKYIEISIGSPELPALVSGSLIETSEETDLFTKSGNIMEDIGRQFSKEGQISLLLTNIDILTKNLAKLTSDIKTKPGLLNELIYSDSGKKFNSSISHMEEILSKINKGQGSLGALINDPTVYEDLKNLFGGAKRSNVLKYFMRQFIEDGEKDSKKNPNK